MKIEDIYKVRNSKLEQNGYLSYQEYLNSEEWSCIKSKIRKRTASKWRFCNVCGGSKYLDIHHSSYKVIGTTNPGNTVKVLCRNCHSELHEISKSNRDWSFYKIFGQMRSYRKKNNLPIFIYPNHGNR